jgi:hypothetical protein
MSIETLEFPRIRGLGIHTVQPLLTEMYILLATSGKGEDEGRQC